MERKDNDGREEEVVGIGGGERRLRLPGFIKSRALRPELRKRPGKTEDKSDLEV